MCLFFNSLKYALRRKYWRCSNLSKSTNNSVPEMENVYFFFFFRDTFSYNSRGVDFTYLVLRVHINRLCIPEMKYMFGEMFVGERPVRGNVILGTVRWENVCLGNCLFGELSFGELSVGKISLGSCPSGENLSG